MGKLSKDQLTQRRKQLRLDAQRDIAKSEVLQFRIDETAVNRIHVLADKEQIAVGTMIRKWVMERLTAEETGEGANSFSGSAADGQVISARMVQEALVQEHSYLATIKQMNEDILKELKDMRSEKR